MRLTLELLDDLHDRAIIKRTVDRHENPQNPDIMCYDRGRSTPSGIIIDRGLCYNDRNMTVGMVVSEINSQLEAFEPHDGDFRAIEIASQAIFTVVNGHPYATSNHRTSWEVARWILIELVEKEMFDDNLPIIEDFWNRIRSEGLSWVDIADFIKDELGLVPF